jgi:trk system potassium uptake protein TrkH
MRTVYYTHGICLVGLAIFMLAPALLDLYTGGSSDWKAFFITSFLCFFIGGILIFANKAKEYDLSVRHAYLLTTTLWVTIPFAAAIPFYLVRGTYHLSVTNAIFESVSGISTTGSTVYVGLDNAPHGILLWRAITCYLGGIGIVVLTMGMLPYLRVGGMQLFQTESSDRTEKVLPKTYQIALLTTGIYTTIIILCAVAYYFGGMSAFDAIAHSMPTIATAGFSTHDGGFAYFNKPQLEWIGSVFMIAAATPMLLYYSLIMGHSSNRALLEQARFFWAQVFFMVMAVTFYVYFTSDKPFEEVLRQTTFNLTSITTTTGFTSTDYSKWGSFAIMMFYFATVVGGCTGSTSGGIKTFRIQAMIKMVRLQVKKLIMPHGVFTEHIGGKTLTEGLSRSVALFFLVYVATFAIVATGMASSGLDMLTCLSGAATSMAGVGPGLGPIIGPVGNFSTLSDVAKWFLIFGMISGRLEVITILVLLTKNFWEDL